MEGKFRNASECWQAIKAKPEDGRNMLPEIERFARTNSKPANVSFGTSGWRGEIGTDFTFHNVRIVARAIINTLKSEDTAVKKALGIKDFDDVKSRGIIVGHDNRFLGPDFAKEVMEILASEKIKVYYAGETSTPEISASIEMLKASCGINLTPSHNPSNYSGLKFNPSDGGPAGPEITNLIQSEANRLMEGGRALQLHSIEAREYEKIDTTEIYLSYIRQRGTINLDLIRNFARESDCTIIVDHVHGSTRGRPARLLDQSMDKLKLLRTSDDYLFGGVAPEPSADNMKGVERAINESSAKYRLGVIMDPDGDRIRFADQHMQIPMNYFGAMALHFLHVYKGIKGITAKSVGTSNFVNAIADKHKIPVRETKVGFKNFRPFLLPGSSEKAIIAFEESDGISGYNHTLEKDALFGLLLAIEMVATTGKNLSEYLNELLDEYGYYYPDRSGIEVDRSLVGAPLKHKLSVIQERYPKGGSIQINSKTMKISNVITVDGIKVVLEDGSWLMIRPSGTEPKVRFYIESRTPEGKEKIFKTARRLTEEAISSRD
ncbi:phosphoglucomutase [bacterium BMS3Abin07]|nr:phosphoglucomutase [bacterium BMS3Abin07]GBE31185.1 phosphoglucomutase [bacterium BMS3Bbin05]HDO23487.1 phosphomannomutase [Nitrospirota bacterium]